MKYILSHPRLTKSARPLAAKLSQLTNQKIMVDVGIRNPNTDNLIIRYGNSGNQLVMDTQYNSPEMIRLAGNKLRLSNLLVENNFSHVEYMRGNVDVEEFPVIVRKELDRGGGIGIEICRNQEEFNRFRGFAWSYWYDFKFELGVHILGGKIVRVFKKVREEGLPEEEFPIRNTQRGYSFKLRNNWEEKYNGLKKFVEELYKIVPIQFARLDVGYIGGERKGEYKLIEINSAPDLSQNENTLNMYAQFLAERIF